MKDFSHFWYYKSIKRDSNELLFYYVAHKTHSKAKKSKVWLTAAQYKMTIKSKMSFKNDVNWKSSVN